MIVAVQPGSAAFENKKFGSKGIMAGCLTMKVVHGLTVRESHLLSHRKYHMINCGFSRTKVSLHISKGSQLQSSPVQYESTQVS